jgi:hypothetical protein
LSCEANSDLFVNKNKIINFWSIFVMGGVWWRILYNCVWEEEDEDAAAAEKFCV